MNNIQKALSVNLEFKIKNFKHTQIKSKNKIFSPPKKENQSTDTLSSKGAKFFLCVRKLKFNILTIFRYPT